MPKLNCIVAFLIGPLLLMAQPDNNTCAGVINLGTAPICDNTLYSNVGATPYDIDFDNNPSCFVSTPPANDVWFQFTTSDEDIDYTLSVGSNGPNSISNLQLAIYRGQCDINSMALRQCAISDEGATAFSFDLIDFDPATIYFLRIDNYGGDTNEGMFNICLEEKSNSFTIDAGGSEACSGTLYDSGGPNGDYQNNEDQIFTICPSEFHNCISFDLNYFNIKDAVFGPGDQITFYDGPSTSSPIIKTIGTSSSNSTNHGGGGVCYTVQAEQCLTIRFKSDSNNTSDGFAGNWECSAQSCVENQSIKISGDLTNQDIEDAITTPLSKVTVDTIICDGRALGTFNGGDETDLGLTKGLLLTTGSPFSAIGPNVSDNSGIINDFDGDNDLDILSQLFGQGSQSYDACVVEMDVQVFSNELTFEYVFASEEYPEFVGREFNDIFALLISGPGIEGIQEINNQLNLATLPNGEFVQTNSVNHLENWEYYRNNTFGNSIEYDGMTSDFQGIKKSLTASTPVIPCNTYRLKVAIADRGDLSYDSGVFISEISSGVPSLEIAFKNSLEQFVESCTGTEDRLIINLSQAFDDTITYRTVIGGTAVKGEDYILNLSDEITFFPGETFKEFSIIPIDDELIEGDENIKIELINDTECGSITIATLDAVIQDKINVEILSDQDTMIACQNTIVQLEATGANDYNWSPVRNLSDPFIANPMYAVDTEGWIQVRGSIGILNNDNCVGYDSIFIKIVDPEVSINPIPKSNYCKGDSIALSGISNILSGSFTWTSSLGNISNNDSIDILTLTNSGLNEQLVLTQQIGGCAVHDTLVLNVDDYFFPEFNFTDITLCQGLSATIVPFVIPSSTEYLWEPAEFLSADNIANPTVKPERDIEYTFTATSENGYCTNDTTINIKVRGLEIEILEADTIKICLGDSKDISAVTGETSSTDNVNWIFDLESVTEDSRVLQNFSPDISGYLYAELETPECKSRDSIYVQVDSLPILDIAPSLGRFNYCKDEIVILVTDPYVQGYYPDIEFQWLDADDIPGGSESLNLAFRSQETRTYVRETVNGLCSSTDSITISVFDFQATSNLMDTTICLGDTIDVLIDSPVPLDNVSWDPNICTPGNCEQVSLSPTFDMDYHVILQSGRCIDSIQFSVFVDKNQVILETDGESTVPLGEEIELTAGTVNDYSGDFIWFVDGAEQVEKNESFILSVEKEETKVLVEIYNDGGCLLSRTSLIVFGGIPEIVFPNAFIPTGEEDNQIFTYAAKINDSAFEQANFSVEIFQIFNRWGQLVFECDNIQCLNEGWNGRKNGQELPAEVYSYQLKATLPNGDDLIQKGTVTLVR